MLCIFQTWIRVISRGPWGSLQCSLVISWRKAQILVLLLLIRAWKERGILFELYTCRIVRLPCLFHGVLLRRLWCIIVCVWWISIMNLVLLLLVRTNTIWWIVARLVIKNACRNISYITTLISVAIKLLHLIILLLAASENNLLWTWLRMLLLQNNLGTSSNAITICQFLLLLVLTRLIYIYSILLRGFGWAN